MNSKSLQCNEIASSLVEVSALPRKPAFGAMVRIVKDWIARSELKQALARYQARSKRAAQAELEQNIIDSLPLEQKHALGMYQFMR